MTSGRLHPADLERLAELLAPRVAEALGDHLGARPAPELVDATELAAQLSVTPEWVRDHADDLGAVPLGNGRRPRLRFDPRLAAERMASRLGSERSQAPVLAQPSASRQRRQAPAEFECPLLPVRPSRG